MSGRRLMMANYRNKGGANENTAKHDDAIAGRFHRVTPPMSQYVRLSCCQSEHKAAALQHKYAKQAS
jgi:hypothetical protein